MRSKIVQGFFLCFAAGVLLLPALSASAATGAVTVVNDTDFTLEIRMDGAKKCTLKPGAEQTLDAIPEGAHTFQAVTSEGEVKFRKEMRVVAGRTVSWILKWTHLLPAPQAGFH